MKRMACLLLLAVLLYACLPGSVWAEEELAEVRCDEWRFSVRVPAGLNVYPVAFEDSYGDSVFSGGLSLSAGGIDDIPQVRIIRRNCFYDVYGYLNASFWDYLDQCGTNEAEESCRVYRFGGRTLYGNAGIVYGDAGEERFRECRLIPVSENRGTEFIVRYTAETEADVFALLDTVVRYYLPDEEPEKLEAKFLPDGHTGEPDLQNGGFLLRVENADRIETDGYFTAVLYKPDYYSPEDVRAMKPGDTILIMDRILTITGIEPNGVLDDDNWYEAELCAVGQALTEESFDFTLMLTEDGSAFWPYFGNDNHAASRVGEVRISVPQPESVVELYNDSEEEPEQLSADLLGSFDGDPAMLGIGWNEYNHRCFFRDGSLIRVETWSYPYSPEDPFTPWEPAEEDPDM